jgi:uncharacterized protein YndB with AHSA1/START domain
MTVNGVLVRERVHRLWFVAAALLLTSLPTHATVVEVAPAGFAVRHEIAIDAPPDRVYRAFVDIARWWNPDHTYSGSASNLSIDARPGGCFCEKLADGGGVEHMRVVYVMPGRQVRLSGALGPLQGSGLAGSMTWQLAAAANGTRLVMTYSVGGYMQGGFEKMAGAVDGVLGEQVRRLKDAAETAPADGQRKSP